MSFGFLNIKQNYTNQIYLRNYKDYVNMLVIQLLQTRNKFLNLIIYNASLAVELQH